ncbi:hypothetical protein BGW36DRAFT_309502 [Talaromyces proteolyticus]|uniref:Phytanoyl-CoA dioxygenase n=1 Tax=Talaromyces proteolyticus TaxID=1131652 RepID=A0AAD4KED8_9EURO|nr:uncharacterized protein BGW36DRAFT_309502 [Talaromyces proteolyticus]KAH8688827.1 hypothetical protein BGW36DRAFT_309502 [Talaromyces proteolyticus]
MDFLRDLFVYPYTRFYTLLKGKKKLLTSTLNAGQPKSEVDYFTGLTNRNHDAPPLPEDPVTRADIEAVLKDGFVVLDGLLTEEDIKSFREEIDHMTGEHPKFGRHMFEGRETIRIYSLLNKTRKFDKCCLFDRVLALNDYFLMKGYCLSATSSIQINPGEKPQMLHHDDGYTYLPRPRPPMGSAIMIAIDDFTENNGATCMVPGSHLWDSKRRPTLEECVPTVGKAGSVVFFLGTTWHCGGPNTSDKPRRAVTVQYCQPYIRPAENHFLAVDPRRLPEIPEDIVRMMGYGLHKPFIGNVDGLDPLKGARRMIGWFQQPLDPHPPAFATMA